MIQWFNEFYGVLFSRCRSSKFIVSGLSFNHWTLLYFTSLLWKVITNHQTSMLTFLRKCVKLLFRTTFSASWTELISYLITVIYLVFCFIENLKKNVFLLHNTIPPRINKTKLKVATSLTTLSWDVGRFQPLFADLFLAAKYQNVDPHSCIPFTKLQTTSPAGVQLLIFLFEK